MQRIYKHPFKFYITFVIFSGLEIKRTFSSFRYFMPYSQVIKGHIISLPGIKKALRAFLIFRIYRVPLRYPENSYPWIYGELEICLPPRPPGSREPPNTAQKIKIIILGGKLVHNAFFGRGTRWKDRFLAILQISLGFGQF